MFKCKLPWYLYLCTENTFVGLKGRSIQFYELKIFLFGHNCDVCRIRYAEVDAARNGCCCFVFSLLKWIMILTFGPFSTVNTLMDFSLSIVCLCSRTWFVLQIWIFTSKNILDSFFTLHKRMLSVSLLLLFKAIIIMDRCLCFVCISTKPFNYKTLSYIRWTTAIRTNKRVGWIRNWNGFHSFFTHCFGAEWDVI